MANVFLAVARGPSGFNKLLVLKALKPALANDAEFLEMFLNEARLAARLNHPHVVQTYEVGEDRGQHVIVMEYLDGESLSAVQVRARKIGRVFPLTMQLRILADVLAGLHHAHELADFDGKSFELVHRDISPQNVFVTFDGHVKVLDFGIAKAVGGGAETGTGILKGKVRYMAPEQMAGERLDGRADTYAVGAMLWEAVTGQKLWTGLADVVVMHKVMHGEMEPPSSVASGVPASLDRICKKATALRRDDRYATARDFEKDLDEALAELGDVKPRAIGDFVAELFADTRKERKAIIESQLSKVTTLSTGEFSAMTPVILSTSMTGASASGENSPVATDPARPKPARRHVALIAALLVGGAVATAAFLLPKCKETPVATLEPAQRGPGSTEPSQRAGEGPTGTRVAGTEPTPASVETKPPSAAASAAAPAEKVELKIAATPSSAKLYLDDDALPSNPYAASLRKDSSRHKVRAEAFGYETKTQEITADKSADVVVALDRVRQGQPRPRPTGTTTATTATAPATTTAPTATAPPKPNCAQPYFIDAAGIKRIRPDCM